MLKVELCGYLVYLVIGENVARSCRCSRILGIFFGCLLSVGGVVSHHFLLDRFRNITAAVTRVESTRFTLEYLFHGGM